MFSSSYELMVWIYPFLSWPWKRNSSSICPLRGFLLLFFFFGMESKIQIRFGILSLQRDDMILYKLEWDMNYGFIRFA